ncbi:CG11382 [Drosophila busckii]|uniref:CG11382 n=1 Tax=Drosophila busckii TaxID=30019 RepID=A0A0M4EZQ7_DROBS|nr:CG11382 [Drosophila busckii]
MQYALTRTLLASVLLASIALSLAGKPQQQQQQQQQVSSIKPKRDAGLSFGSGYYHGPSHKYLPPAGGSSSSFESSYAALHGNSLGGGSSFDYADLSTHSSPHYHHYSHQPHGAAYSSHGHGYAPVRPVYLSSSGGAGAGAGSYYHQRPKSPKVETYIVQTSNGHGHGGHGGHGAGYAEHGHSSSLGGSYKYLGHGGGSSSSSNYYNLLAHKPHSSSSSYLLANPSASHSNSHHYHGHGHGHAHFAPVLSHGLGHEEHAAGYSYEAPASVHFHKQQQAPISSYGVPLLPAGYEHSQHGLESEHVHEHVEHVESEHAHKTESQPPAYALGQKGLGHFSYTASKPHALNTDVHQYSSISGSSSSPNAIGSGHEQQQQHELFAELSKAPFKPSAFLGAKHESSLGYDYATPTTQYLQPPTASGFDYQGNQAALLYGAAEAATPIFEPESTYLPPVSSYGAPTAPTHNYQ